MLPDRASVDVDGGGLPPPLLPQEDEALGSAAPSRREEFSRGRGCARRALEALGEVPSAILRKGRAPVWPQGVIGSITHCQGLVAAAAARRGPIVSIGIDAELRGRVSPDLSGHIATREELAWLKRTERQPHELTGLWCAKEAIFKCLHPVFGVFLEFRDVAITLDLPSGRFSLSRVDKPLWGSAIPAIDGRVAIVGEYVLASCVLAEPGPRWSCA